MRRQALRLLTRGPVPCAVLAVLAAVSPGQDEPVAPDPQPEELDFEPKGFSIPETRLAKARWEEALDHIEASRWSEATSVLQLLIEEHRGELLAGSVEDSLGRLSRMPVYPGAAESARLRLMTLPARAQAIYQERYGRDAQAALERARRSADRTALLEVARRWPITAAAESAWWTLGDIELELGNVVGATEAWKRAGVLAGHLGGERGEGASARARFARDVAEGGSAGISRSLSPDQDGQASLRLPGPNERSGSPPPSDCHSWRVDIDLDGNCPFNGRSAYQDLNNLFPIVFGDAILVSTSLRLLALDAYTGRLRWASPEPPGWDAVDRGEVLGESGRSLERADFMNGLDRSTLLVAPAAGSGVAVAALQIPITHTQNKNFQQITITTVLPDRRLFAFDIQTGAELWNHMPPPAWDGESGSFEHRMHVAGPPAIVGSRVLVPVYRMRGRIDYHVACYDLWTGALMWSRALISGQRELNMFGRHEWEFAAPPLRIEGSKVIALTQLGSIAALDLYTGTVLWETLYDQLPIPPTRHFAAQRRIPCWTNTPPVIADQVAIATPVDSRDMIGVDLSTGTLLWTIDFNDVFDSRTQPLMTLIGADEKAVYLLGRTLVTCVQPAGFNSRRPPQRAHVSDLLTTPGSALLPRPAMGDRHIVLVTSDRRIVIDREAPDIQDPRLSASLRDGESKGNALLAGGALFSLSGRYLTAFFDWDELEDRLKAELTARPQDADLVSDYAYLLLRRAEHRFESGHSIDARRFLEQARNLLEPLLGQSDDGSLHLGVASELHAVLRLEAEVLTALADPSAALERLRRAQILAPDTYALRDTLLLQETLLRGRDEKAREAVLDQLQAQCGDLPLTAPLSASSSASSPAADREEAEGNPPPRTVGLWVLEQRIELFAGTRRAREELDSLQAILRGYGDVRLVHSQTLVSDRIAELLAVGPSELFRSYEETAQVLLEQALATRDLGLLARVCDLFPHSRAAARANDARIDVALEHGDAATLAQVVLDEFGAQWSLEQASEREIAMLLQLGSVLDDRGGSDFARGVASFCARRDGNLRLPLSFMKGQTLAEWAAQASPREPVPPNSEPTFDERLRARATVPGQHWYLGATPERGQGVSVLLFAGEAGIEAYSSTFLDQPAWVLPLETSLARAVQGGSYLLQGTRLFLALEDRVLALDGETGATSWEFACGEGRANYLVAAGDTLLICIADKRRSLVQAIDAGTGVPLWGREIEKSLWPAPCVEEHSLVFLPVAQERSTALVLDRYTGHVLREFAVSEKVRREDQRAAWIEEGLLIKPCFKDDDPEGNYVVAYDLERGSRAWRVASEEGLNLDSIVRSGGETFLILAATTPQRSGEIWQLTPRLGAVRPVPGVELFYRDLPMGVLQSSVTELSVPYLFILSRPVAERGSRLRAIHLPYGERWSFGFPPSPTSVYNDLVPLPALSESTVAIAYMQARSDESSAEVQQTRLLLLDRDSGTQRDHRDIDPRQGRARHLELIGVGDALLISGRAGIDVYEVER